MIKKNKSLLFLVDDDALFLKTLQISLGDNPDFSIMTFATGELCLESISLNPDVIILDYFLNGINKNAMNGIEALDKINSVNPLIPVIMLSSQDKIDVAIECMKHRAFDYIVKSETSSIRLQKVIDYIIHNQETEEALNWYMVRMS
jgi:two-component system, OmpR family, response regulator